MASDDSIAARADAKASVAARTVWKIELVEVSFRAVVYLDKLCKLEVKYKSGWRDTGKRASAGELFRHASSTIGELFSNA